MKSNATLDEASRINMISRLESERLATVCKIDATERGYKSFLLNNLKGMVGLMHDHRDISQFLHSREGNRAGLAAHRLTLIEIDWMLDELKQQSEKYNAELNQLAEAA